VIRVLTTGFYFLPSLSYEFKGFFFVFLALSLRYLDFGPGFTILSRFLPFLPELVEIRIGSDAPPGMKGSLRRLRVDEEAEGSIRRQGAVTGELSPMQTAALDELPRMIKLRTLVLKDFGEMEVSTYIM
jgi:hypothetical protein